ncbi:hypothetical protein DW646_02810 [Bacteroides sp. AM23-18]|nr:hypothetical protein DW646_02810 [Bacteroides sp. AM23-18]RGX75154.1 hypothetical protein DXA69_00405 [Phocaeicola dorei]RJV48317.1 hypothetical protein DWY42_00830 [Bacteroides sp. AF25-18]
MLFKIANFKSIQVVKLMPTLYSTAWALLVWIHGVWRYQKSRQSLVHAFYLSILQQLGLQRKFLTEKQI